jgi:hypothetical protein
MLWKLDGLSEYDVRRPLVPTGTNLLGMVKHLAGCEAGYFGETFGRPFGESLPWFAVDAPLNDDMWATASEPRAMIVGLYQRVWAHADATIDALGLEAIGHVPWWPDERSEVTLHRILVHMVAETNRHAGHADIVRELIDGAVGMRADRDSASGRLARPKPSRTWSGSSYTDPGRRRTPAAARRAQRASTSPAPVTRGKPIGPASGRTQSKVAAWRARKPSRRSRLARTSSRLRSSSSGPWLRASAASASLGALAQIVV